MNTETASIHVLPAAGSPTAHVISLGELHGESATAHVDAAPHAVSRWNPLHAVRTRLQVCVGDIDISIGELLAAKEHQVLVLDSHIDQAVDLLLEGKVVARGQLVAVDGKFGLRISELPVPLKT